MDCNNGPVKIWNPVTLPSDFGKSVTASADESINFFLQDCIVTTMSKLIAR
jgi:hypothetical protein